MTNNNLYPEYVTGRITWKQFLYVLKVTKEWRELEKSGFFTNKCALYIIDRHLLIQSHPFYYLIAKLFYKEYAKYL